MRQQTTTLATTCLWGARDDTQNIHTNGDSRVKAEIRHRVSELRLWVEEDGKHGKPYYLFLSLVWRDNETVEFVGLTEKIQKEHWNTIIDCCERNRIRRIIAKRFRNGLESEHFIEVNENG